MDGHCTLLEQLDSLPDYLDYIFRLQFVEYPIRTQYYEVVVRLYIELFYLGFGNYYFMVTTEFLILSFDVSESTSNR